MSIEHEYSREIRRHLKKFPVWEPGTAIAPGAVGDLKGGVFIQQTTLDKKNIKFHVAEAEIPGDTFYQSKDSFKSSISGSAADATMTIKFSNAGAVIYHTRNIREARIENLQEVRADVERLKNSGDWERGHVLVSHVSYAENVNVFVSGGADAMLELQGNASLLEKFLIGEVGVKVGGAKNIGYQRHTKGAVLMMMYGFGFFGSTKRMMFSATDANAPLIFGEISPEDPIHDKPVPE